MHPIKTPLKLDTLIQLSGSVLFNDNEISELTRVFTEAKEKKIRFKIIFDAINHRKIGLFH